MFKNVGKEIKSWVKVFIVLYTLGMGLIGVFLGLFLQDENAIFVLAVLFAIIGFLFGRFKAMFAYAYGEMADCLIEIRRIHREYEESLNEREDLD